MKPAIVNGRKIYFDVFIAHADPFILLSTHEIASEGTSKMYFLRRYSMKYAMEDFIKYVDKIAEMNKAKSNEM